MAYEPRTGRLVPAEADEKYAVKVAKQNILTSSVRSFIIVGILVALFIGTILVMGI